jgi:hypothetical protein
VAGVWREAITLRGRSHSNLACVRNLKSKEIHMGMPLFAVDALFTPLQQFARALARRFAAAPTTQLATPAAADASRRVSRACTSRPLRVVRVLEASASPSAGRMVISGRMADVCAELERLAALEAAAG